METNGIIEEVSESNSPYPIYYLPHSLVVRGSSLTTKIRHMCDASATGYNHISLNDITFLAPDLTGVLMRFRRWKFALTADISKAFLKIQLKREDQDVHRFFSGWIRVKSGRCAFGVTSSLCLLNATIKHHLNQFSDNKIVDELGQNIYVDD